VASWAIGGISYATTQKSLTDHGISAVIGRDCAMTKVLTDGTLCADDIPPEMQAAQADGVVVKYRHAKLRPHLKKSYQKVSLDFTDPDLGKFSVVPAEEPAGPVKAGTPTEANELAQHSLKPSNEAPDEDLLEQENWSVSEEQEISERKDVPGFFLAFVSVLFPDTASEDDSAVQSRNNADETQRNDQTDPDAITTDHNAKSLREEMRSESPDEGIGAPEIEREPPRLRKDFGKALPAAGLGEGADTLQSDVAPRVLRKSPATPVNESRFYGLTRPFKFCLEHGCSLNSYPRFPPGFPLRLSAGKFSRGIGSRRGRELRRRQLGLASSRKESSNLKILSARSNRRGSSAQ